jgi:hypothetical protein
MSVPLRIFYGFCSLGKLLNEFESRNMFYGDAVVPIIIGLLHCTGEQYNGFSLSRLMVFGLVNFKLFVWELWLCVLNLP